MEDGDLYKYGINDGVILCATRKCFVLVGSGSGDFWLFFMASWISLILVDFTGFSSIAFGL